MFSLPIFLAGFLPLSLEMADPEPRNLIRSAAPPVASSPTRKETENIVDSHAFGGQRDRIHSPS